MTRDRSAHCRSTEFQCVASRLFLSLILLGVVPATPALSGPNWRPPATDANGDLDEHYYSELIPVASGTSDATTRNHAASALSIQDLPRDAQFKAYTVLNNTSLYRRLPTLRFAVDSAAYTYLLKHPDVAVSSWRAMEISQFDLKRTAENRYHADAQDGSVGTIEVWRTGADETLIYCDGSFKSPLVARPIQAKAVMHLRTRFFEGADGTPQAEHTGDVFVSFPSQTVETIARLISPISHSIADRNFRQLTLYAHLMSAAMSRHPAWVESIVRRMDASAAQKEELLQVSQGVRKASEKRTEAAVLGQSPMPPVRTTSINSNRN